MADNEAKGFVINTRNLTFALSMIGVLGFGYRVVSYIKDNEFTNATQDEYIAQDKEQTKVIVEELKQLNSTVSQLVFIIKGADEIRKSEHFDPKIQ